MEHLEHYKIAFSVGTYSIELSSHDKDWVEEKMKELGLNDLLKNKPSEMDTGKIEQGANKEKSSGISGSISINEFYKKYIKEKKVSGRPDISIFFVYYLSKIKKLEQITSAEVKNCFRDIGYPQWNTLNISDALYKGKKKAMLNNINDLWMLSMTGEDFVLNIITE